LPLTLDADESIEQHAIRQLETGPALLLALPGEPLTLVSRSGQQSPNSLTNDFVIAVCERRQDQDTCRIDRVDADLHGRSRIARQDPADIIRVDQGVYRKHGKQVDRQAQRPKLPVDEPDKTPATNNLPNHQRQTR
jgi:hypothetical protein